MVPLDGDGDIGDAVEGVVENPVVRRGPAGADPLADAVKVIPGYVELRRPFQLVVPVGPKKDLRSIGGALQTAVSAGTGRVRVPLEGEKGAADQPPGGVGVAAPAKKFV